LFIIEGIRLRRIQGKLEDQRIGLMEETKNELDRIFPDQPVAVAGIMLRLQETIFKP
jgi:hypothetical protein